MYIYFFLQNKVHRESERKLMEVQSQLQLTSEKLVKAKNIQASLKMQLELTHEEVSLKEEEVDDLKEGQRLVEEELRKTRDQLRLERERWAVERDSINQVHFFTKNASCKIYMHIDNFLFSSLPLSLPPSLFDPPPPPPSLSPSLPLPPLTHSLPPRSSSSLLSSPLSLT